VLPNDHLGFRPVQPDPTSLVLIAAPVAPAAAAASALEVPA
jgi:hypothetical protein